MTHFVHLPVTPPPDVLEKIPPELPSFLGNTIPSRYVLFLFAMVVTSLCLPKSAMLYGQ